MTIIMKTMIFMMLLIEMIYGGNETTHHPSKVPTINPSFPTTYPTNVPTVVPTSSKPSSFPTPVPTSYPTPSPTYHICVTDQHNCDVTVGGVCYTPPDFLTKRDSNTWANGAHSEWLDHDTSFVGQNTAHDETAAENAQYGNLNLANREHIYKCGCKEGYVCTAGCSPPFTGHTCNITLSPTYTPTLSPTINPTTSPTTINPTASPTTIPTSIPTIDLCKTLCCAVCGHWHYSYCNKCEHWKCSNCNTPATHCFPSIKQLKDAGYNPYIRKFKMCNNYFRQPTHLTTLNLQETLPFLRLFNRKKNKFKFISHIDLVEDISPPKQKLRKSNN